MGSCCNKPEMITAYKITAMGKSCICTELHHVLDDVKTHLEETNCAITVQSVQMTREQYEKLEEFEGW